MLAAMWVGVLGPTEVSHSGRAVTVQAAKHRALLAALALSGGRPTPADDLVAAIWGPDAPPSALGTLQTYVSVIRRTLEPDLPARAPSTYLTSTDHGYCVVADTDVAEFTATVRATHGALTQLTNAAVPVADDHGAAVQHIAALDRALALWRGTPFADLPDSDAVVPERARLEELRLLALEDRATLQIACGNDSEAIHELEALTAAHPLRERLWTLLAVALARTGRQADALATLDRLRTALDEELGLDPSAAVRELQTTILRQELPAASAPAPTTGPDGTGVGEVRIQLPDWPMVGRGSHLEVLESLLAKADEGEPRFVSIVGEPGAGKTRLGAELAVRARDTGALILVGRCSQEEDAPPLWPWTSALGPLLDDDGLLDEDGVPPLDHDAARFAFAERVRTVLTGLSADRTVVLGLEDLHWADPSSLRILRHLVSHVDRGRLMVVCTWRRNEQTEALSEASAALARRHATRLELTGLSADETHDLLTALTGDANPQLATAVHQRTEGNPFFLIEYGRLARDEHRPLGDVLASLPGTVADVVRRRIGQLPERSRAALTAGAAIGREFGIDLLAQGLGATDLETLDLLEPALAAELVQDLGGDRFRFGHALVRDTAYDDLSPSRRERLHASLAALVEAAPDAGDRSSEIARHWAAAGQRHRGRAWRAAADAGARALAAHAADEAAAQYRSALDLHADEPAATRPERYDLLVRYAEACRWSTRRLEMHAALDEAVVLAGKLGDPDLVVRAASVSTRDALWPARAYGEVNHDVISVIRSALTVLRGDTEVRCRLLLALASEAYYAAPPEEIDAVCDEAIGIARRLGDSGLLVEALQGGMVTTFRRSTAERRRAWGEEALVLALRAGDERATINVRCLLAAIRCELGDVIGIDDELRDVIDAAHAQKMYFVEMVSLTLVHCWAAMRGDQAVVDDTFLRLTEAFDLVSTAHKVDTVQGAALFVPLWDPSAPTPPADDVMTYMAESAIPVAPAAAVLALRHGMDDEARLIVDAFGVDLETDNWFSPFVWALGAELGLRLDDPDLAAGAYAKLAEYHGSNVMSGTSPAHGPVDAYLALAAAAVGETGLAARHAEVALEQVRAWRIPQVEKWFLGLRDRHGF